VAGATTLVAVVDLSDDLAGLTMMII